jgi:xanthine dehydrogenase YagT iron-sulfur-binding subunit
VRLVEEDDDSQDGLSRRDFLRGSAAAGVLGMGLIAGEIEAAEKSSAPAGAGGEVAGPGAVPLRFRINGDLREARLEPRATLLDALRGAFDLTGAKEVCDRGACGACTVLLGGKAVYACGVLAIEVQGRPIQTIEGLGRPDKPHPLQAAFAEHDAGQCGLCIPGFVMATRGLLDRNPDPGPAEVRQGLAGNLCRCGNYDDIQQAVLAAAAAGEPEGRRRRPRD